MLQKSLSVMTENKPEVDEAFCKDHFILNHQQNGYFRKNEEPTLFSMISSYLEKSLILLHGRYRIKSVRK